MIRSAISLEISLFQWAESCEPAGTVSSFVSQSPYRSTSGIPYLAIISSVILLNRILRSFTSLIKVGLPSFGVVRTGVDLIQMNLVSGAIFFRYVTISVMLEG